jgi:hypothetical protein
MDSNGEVTNIDGLSDKYTAQKHAPGMRTRSSTDLLLENYANDSVY